MDLTPIRTELNTLDVTLKVIKEYMDDYSLWQNVTESEQYLIDTAEELEAMITELQEEQNWIK